MPLTKKGRKIMKAMTRPVSAGGYGRKKGESVFYASRNKGTISGVERALAVRKERRKKRKK